MKEMVQEINATTNELEERISSLEGRVEAIERRNKKVELDKSWETSFERRATIAILTYLLIVLFFIVAKLPKPFINPIVPTVGYIFSTLSISCLKKLWIKRQGKHIPLK